MEEFITHIRPLSQMRLFKKGSAIIFQGEIPRKGFLVRDGVVRAYTVKPSGEQMIVGFFTKGDIFPVPWLFEASSNALFYYEALEDVRVLTFSKQDFLKTISSNSSLLLGLSHYLAKQYTAQLVRITAIGQSRAIEKISFTLYYLLFRYGIEKEDGNFILTMKLSHLTIANLTGLTRESTTINLKQLKDKGIINYPHPTFSINKQKLENLIGEDGFTDLSF